MPIAPDLLGTVTAVDSQQAWDAIAGCLWTQFSAPIKSAAADSEIVNRDTDLTELDNVLSGSAWDLWKEFEASIPKASQSIVDFWSATHGGKAVLILDGLSLREAPWLLQQAAVRGYKVHQSGLRAAELPAETTPFANSLGFGQRSALENNQAGSAHKLKGAYTITCNLPWLDCVELVPAHEAVVFWHHWPDERMHDLSGPGATLHKLAKETQSLLTSDDFWSLVGRLTTGRRLLVTSDHGYAAPGHYPDLTDKDQATYMKKLFKSGRCASGDVDPGPWQPPIDLELTTSHGKRQYVLGRKKWKSAAGYPTLQHGGLSLLEVFVPLIEISK